MPITAAILGASGYGGAELLRLLSAHPDIEPRVLTADSSAGSKLGDIYPHLDRFRHLPLRRLSECGTELSACDVVFCALPHGEAMRVLPSLQNRLIIDFGGDFRLVDAAEYEYWYGTKHLAPGLLGTWIYGLPELFRSEIRGAARIANPGCYATASILSIAPLLKAGLIEGPILVSAMSGLSGAGRVPKAELHFSHATEDVRAYKAGRHQHTPEIELALRRFSGKETTVTLIPHLVPMARGIHATTSAALKPGAAEKDVMEAFRECYASEPFVRVESRAAGTKDVRGSNFARITPVLDLRNGLSIVTCVIDNLVKGTAGQALQNANCALGIEETRGLPHAAVYP